jgi:nucleoporin POM152
MVGDALYLTLSILTGSAMDVGATASFDFSGIPPFVVEYTEQRDRHRPVTRTAQFRGYAGDIVLTPEQEGEYTYVSYWMSRAQP